MSDKEWEIPEMVQCGSVWIPHNVIIFSNSRKEVKLHLEVNIMIPMQKDYS